MKKHSSRAGFTLIEILTVVLIVGILSVILIANIWGAREGANASATRALISQLEAVADMVERETGDYPPSSFGSDVGANDGTNVGIEAFVAALFSEGRDGLGGIPEDELANIDRDRASENVSDLGRELFEIVDAWGNPIAYIHHRDYEDETREYVSYSAESGEEIQGFVVAHRNEATNRYKQKTKYQFISAGSDGVFGTDDDITNFQR